jgi:Protein of unknown function (DUF1566)
VQLWPGVAEAEGCRGSVKLLDWDSAMGLHWQGDAAWRLPQRDELQSIVAPGCKKPAVNETVFPGTPSIQYWTSTATGSSYAWVVFFRTGMATWNFLKTTPFAVRLVPNRSVADELPYPTPIFLPEPNWISLLSFPERRPGHTILPSASNMSCRSCGRDRR